MFNRNKLKGRIIEAGYTIEQLAGLIGVNPATFYRKMAQSSEFTRNEILAIKLVLDLTNEEINDIFFA